MSATITLNCAYIDWIEIDKNDLEIWYDTALGTRDSVQLSKWDCEYYSARDNMDDLLQDLEQNIGGNLPKADRAYLEQKLYKTIERWSRQDDDIYC